MNSVKCFLIVVVALFSTTVFAQTINNMGGPKSNFGNLNRITLSCGGFDDDQLTINVGEPIVTSDAFDGNGGYLGIGAQPGADEDTITTVERVYPEENLGVSIFPNPTPGLVTVKIDSDKAINYRLVVYDMQGRKIEAYRINKETNVLGFGYFPSGMYILNLMTTDGEQVDSYKIVKN